LCNTPIDFDEKLPPHAGLQWKGTEIHMTATCKCNAQIQVDRDMAYKVDCQGCGAHYNCHPNILATKLSCEQVRQIPFIHKPEVD
jgi:hypothetical protein